MQTGDLIKWGAIGLGGLMVINWASGRVKGIPGVSDIFGDLTGGAVGAVIDIPVGLVQGVGNWFTGNVVPSFTGRPEVKPLVKWEALTPTQRTFFKEAPWGDPQSGAFVYSAEYAHKPLPPDLKQAQQKAFALAKERWLYQQEGHVPLLPAIKEFHETAAWRTMGLSESAVKQLEDLREHYIDLGLISPRSTSR